MAGIYTSTKSLVESAFIELRAALVSQNLERANKLQDILQNVFKDTIDDNERLMILLKETEQKLLALGEQA